MTAAQTFLCNGGTLAELEQRWGIKAKRHADFPSLVMLKYDQINSPMGERIVQECRGLMLDEDNNWRVVARPFDKFFNHGEGHATPLDWSTARVLEKVDGSLMTLYYYEGEWRVASSGMPDARGQVNALGMTFAELFWQAFEREGFQLPPLCDHDLAFMFELTSKHNRVVVAHGEPSLTLIGVRRDDGVEYDPDKWHEYRPVRSFSLSSLADVEASFATMSPLSQEGYVIRDAAFRRLKVKHPGYVAIHHLKDGFGPKRMVEIIRMGETTELLTHFPEWRTEFDEVSARYEQLADSIEADFEDIRHIEEQKAFALEATKTKWAAALFQLRNGRAKTAKDYLASMNLRTLMETLGLKAEAQ